jgi:DNA-binding LytR/AlgR family response regulator
VDVTLYQDGIDIIDRYSCQFDIVFCDIQMKIMDGLETARKIRKKDANVVIIFITNLSEYAIQGYEVEAIGYLLKPMNFTSFSMYLGRAIKIIKDKETDYLVLNFKNSIKRIELADIYYIDYAKHYVSIHTKYGCEKALLSMKELEKRLEGKCFSRCNSGGIVNLAYVQNLDDNVITVNDNIITISRSRKKLFIAELTDYLGGKNA